MQRKRLIFFLQIRLPHSCMGNKWKTLSSNYYPAGKNTLDPHKYFVVATDISLNLDKKEQSPTSTFNYLYKLNSNKTSKKKKETVWRRTFQSRIVTLNSGHAIESLLPSEDL